MKATELIVGQLQQSLGNLQWTLADFSDQDMLARPCGGANHPLWQLGHLCVAETGLMSAIRPGAMPELPAGFAERFHKDTAKTDDISKFGTKQDLMDHFAKVRGATIAVAKSMSESDLDKPGPENFRAFAPTVGDMLLVQVTHQMMHMGQMQVARRKLGKKILF